ncbi:MAG TPA: Ig-like domain-containing protein [Verrucomicrobiae bacterium]
MKTNPIPSFASRTLWLATVALALGVISGAAQILPVNPGPTTNPPVVLNEDSSGTFTFNPLFIFACTGTNPAGPAVYTVTSGPTNGILVFNSASNPPIFTYTPAMNFNGSDGFVVQLAHGTNCTTNVFIQPITVNPVNDRPTAQSLTLTIPANRSKAIQLLGADVDGDALTYTLNTSSTRGTITGTPPNLTYTPGSNFIGSDSFTYSVSDGITSSGTASATIIVKNGITVTGVSVTEGNSGTVNAAFKVNLTAPPTENVTVTFATSNGTALAGSDYRATNGTLAFTAGTVTQKVVTVAVIGDRLFELQESFSLQLGSPVNAVFVNSSGLCLIANDDSPVGTATLTPDVAVARVKVPIDYDLVWVHPVQWRQIDSIDLKISDDAGTAMFVRWHETENAFSLLNPHNGKFVRTAAAGSPSRFETELATVYLEKCDSLGSGPTGQSVIVSYSISFKPLAAGRSFNIEAFATDDLGNEQGFEPVGAVAVRRR